MLIFGFYIAQNNKNPHVTLFKHCISKTARYSILTPLVKKSYLGDKLLNPEYQVIASESVNTPPGPSVGGPTQSITLLHIWYTCRHTPSNV